MFEYQGWLTISASYYEDEVAEQYFDNVIIKELFSELEKISAPNFECGIRFFNGRLRCWFIGFSNHKSDEWKDILNFLNLVSKKANGSYGIFSFHDDEEQGKENMFQHIILKKGKIIIMPDSFLSPCIPEIEEI